MKLSKIAALLMLPVLALTLAACSAPKGDAKGATSGDAQIAELIAQKAVECRGGGRAVPAAAAKGKRDLCER